MNLKKLKEFAKLDAKATALRKQTFSKIETEFENFKALLSDDFNNFFINNDLDAYENRAQYDSLSILYQFSNTSTIDLRVSCGNIDKSYTILIRSKEEPIYKPLSDDDISNMITFTENEINKWEAYSRWDYSNNFYIELLMPGEQLDIKFKTMTELLEHLFTDETDYLEQD